MAVTFFGNSEVETKTRVCAALDQPPLMVRVDEDQLVGRVRHLITGEVIRPDGLLVFPNDETLRCLSGRAFALELKPDVVVKDHLKAISELTEQARSYVDSRYDLPALLAHDQVDDCVMYPNLEVVLANMERNVEHSIHTRDASYKQGVIDMHRRMLARQRIYELELLPGGGFRILCCDEPLCRFDGTWRITGKNHQFRRKVGSDYL